MNKAAPSEKRPRVRRQELPLLEIDPLAVDAASPVPAYLQVEQDLRRQIQSSGLRRDARLPRETELAELYGISRMTLRNALARLEGAELVRREHGVGTLINPQSTVLTCDLSLMKRLQTQIRDQGFEPGVVITQRKAVKPAAKVATALDMADDDDAHFIERLITVDRRPTALIRSWVPAAILPGELVLEENSIWKTIEIHLGRRIVRTSNWIELIELGTHDSHQLGMEERAATVGLTGIAFDETDRPVEYSVAYWGGNARIHFDASA